MAFFSGARGAYPPVTRRHGAAACMGHGMTASYAQGASAACALQPLAPLAHTTGGACLQNTLPVYTAIVPRLQTPALGPPLPHTSDWAPRLNKCMPSLPSLPSMALRQGISVAGGAPTTALCRGCTKEKAPHGRPAGTTSLLAMKSMRGLCADIQKRQGGEGRSDLVQRAHCVEVLESRAEAEHRASLRTQHSIAVSVVEC